MAELEHIKPILERVMAEIKKKQTYREQKKVLELEGRIEREVKKYEIP